MSDIKGYKGHSETQTLSCPLQADRKCKPSKYKKEKPLMRVASFLPSLSTLGSLRQASSQADNYCRPDPHLLANTCPAQRALLSSAVSVLGQAWRIRPPEVFPPDLGTTRLAPRINHLLVRLTSKVQSCYCARPCLPSALYRALDSENTCKVSAKLSWPGCLSTVHLSLSW